MEGEVGELGDGDEELYCVCRQKSYGEMIGCDAPDCEIEWVSLPDWLREEKNANI